VVRKWPGCIDLITLFKALKVVASLGHIRAVDDSSVTQNGLEPQPENTCKYVKYEQYTEYDTYVTYMLSVQAISLSTSAAVLTRNFG
jgi:hypothetical protein